jgi:hypothetical protein
MKIKQLDDQYLVRFEVGEVLPDALVTLARDQTWKSGSVVGLGGVKNVVLGYFDLEVRQYLRLPVDGIVELVSLLGNLSQVDGAPFWHLHASVANRDGCVTGGHLFCLEVAITIECWVRASNVPIERTHDDHFGLKLLNI